MARSPSDAADVSLERLNLIDSNNSGESVSEVGQKLEMSCKSIVEFLDFLTY